MGKIRKFGVYLIFFCLSSCALMIPNVEICVDKGRFGAFCQYTTNADMKRQLSVAQWLSVREQDPQFCFSPDSLGAYNSFISKQCAITAFNKNPFIWCEKQKAAPQVQPKFSASKDLTGLTTITIPNIMICADEISRGAFCKFTRSSQSQNLSEAQWNQMRPGMFCMGTEALGAYQTFIERSCNLNKNCVEAAKLKRTLSILRSHQQQVRVEMRLSTAAPEDFWGRRQLSTRNR